MHITELPSPDITLQATVSEREGVVLLQIPKAVVILTRREFMTGLQRGKRYRRHQALAERMRPAAEEGVHGHG